MVINDDLLLASGGELLDYKMDEIIFNEGNIPKYYFQVKSGIVKINSYHEDGKEIIHNIPLSGHCFAETFLFIDKKYPVNAIAMTDSRIIKLEKTKFLQLINQSPELLPKLYSFTAERMYYRHIMLNTLSVDDPVMKIKWIMDSMKSYNNFTEQYSYQFPFTRQHLAALTGLRVETVIRVIKKMEKEKILKVENRKIFY